MKVAILLTGNLRTWDQCKQQFIDTFGNTDVFLSTYNMRYGYHPVLRGRFNDYTDEIISNDYILDQFKDVNLKSYIIEDYLEVERFIDEELKIVHPSMNTHPASFGQYRKLKQCVDLLIMEECKVNEKYDLIIRTRCDMIYDKDIHFKIEGNQILHNTPSIPGTEFIPDQVLVSSRDNMINVSNFIFNEFYNPVYDDSLHHPPHGILRNAIRYLNLSKVEKDIFKGMLRKNGNVD